jgi:hypothetical protein
VCCVLVPTLLHPCGGHSCGRWPSLPSISSGTSCWAAGLRLTRAVLCGSTTPKSAGDAFSPVGSRSLLRALAGSLVIVPSLDPSLVNAHAADGPHTLHQRSFERCWAAGLCLIERVLCRSATPSRQKDISDQFAQQLLSGHSGTAAIPSPLETREPSAS